MPDDNLKDYYKGENLSGSDEISELAKSKIGPFLGKEEKEPVSDLDGEIRPMDWVLLKEGDPFYVGNHPLIALAFARNVPGRVTAKVLSVLKPHEMEFLRRKTGITLTFCNEVHVVFFKNQEKPFVFWEPFLQKVDVEGKRPIIVTTVIPKK